MGGVIREYVRVNPIHMYIYNVTVAIVLYDYCARYAPLPTPLVYAIHHTISVMAILCKGQRLGAITSYIEFFFIAQVRRPEPLTLDGRKIDRV